MSWKFWLAVIIVIAGPMVWVRVWEDSTIEQIITSVIAWVIICSVGIVTGTLTYRRVCGNYHGSFAPSRWQSAMTALLLGFLFGLPGGYLAVVIGALYNRSDAINNLFLIVLLMYAATSGGVAFIFGAGLGQSSRHRSNNC